MTINELQNLTPTSPTAGGPAATDRIRTEAFAEDASTLDGPARFKAAVDSGKSMAASVRVARLQSLAHAVRSGDYRPIAAQLADQIIVQTELEARLTA